MTEKDVVNFWRPPVWPRTTFGHGPRLKMMVASVSLLSFGSGPMGPHQLRSSPRRWGWALCSVGL